MYDYTKYDQVTMTSYSQEGEDLILAKLFSEPGGKVFRNGVYIDVGAHHPTRFSNTNLLSQQFGWAGINIDPNPGFKKLFDEARPQDTNLEMGVSEAPDHFFLNCFGDPALNTFDVERAELVHSWGTIQSLGTRYVLVDTLANILASHLQGNTIDFLSVDTEGHDLQVLRSNDWEIYRSLVVLVECLGYSLDALADNPIYCFMNEKGYTLYAKTCSTFIFADREFLDRKKRSEYLKRPLISIVFPTMNRLDLLKKTMASILEEMDGIGDYEVVVVDGQSTDGTPEYLRSLPNVRLLTETELKGTASAFDMALRAAKGEWVCWLNDDIKVMPGAFKRMLTFMTDPKNSNVGMGAFPNSRSGKALDTFVIRAAWEFPVIYANFGFLRRSLLESVGYIDTAFKKFSWDPDLAMKIWDRGLRVAPCPGANIVHYYHEDSQRANDSAKLDADSRHLFNKWRERYDSGAFRAVWNDPDYYNLAAPLLDGWPKLNLLLCFGEVESILDKARNVYRRLPGTLATYYTFALRLMNYGLLEDARMALLEILQAETITVQQKEWAMFKIGECLDRQGKTEDAACWYLKTLAINPNHSRSRLCSLSEDSPLKVAIGYESEELDRISLPMNIFKISEWDYYFDRRPADDLQLEIKPNDFHLNFFSLGRMLRNAVSTSGVCRIVIRGGERLRAYKVPLLLDALKHAGFNVFRESAEGLFAGADPASFIGR